MLFDVDSPWAVVIKETDVGGLFQYWSDREWSEQCGMEIYQ